MEDLIQHYADHLQTERNVSPHTLRNYLSDLAQFHNFLRERELCLDSTGNVDVRKVDIYVVRTFLAALTRDRKKSSIGRKLAALKGFFPSFGAWRCEQFAIWTFGILLKTAARTTRVLSARFHRTPFPTFTKIKGSPMRLAKVRAQG